AEMQPRIAGGIIARLADYLLRLYPSVVTRRNPRADGSTVRLYADQLDLQPVVVPAHVVAKQRRRFVQIDNQHVDVAVIIEIAEGASAAAVRSRDAGTGGFDQLLKLAIA